LFSAATFFIPVDGLDQGFEFQLFQGVQQLLVVRAGPGAAVEVDRNRHAAVDGGQALGHSRLFAVGFHQLFDPAGQLAGVGQHFFQAAEFF